jgi:hypothetical protein
MCRALLLGVGADRVSLAADIGAKRNDSMINGVGTIISLKSRVVGDSFTVSTKLPHGENRCILRLLYSFC